MTVDTPESKTCSCKYLLTTPHRRFGVMVARLPRTPCEVHDPAVEAPLPWEHPDADPLGDINKAIVAMSSGYPNRDSSEQSAPPDNKETTP